MSGALRFQGAVWQVRQAGRADAEAGGAHQHRAQQPRRADLAGGAEVGGQHRLARTLGFAWIGLFTFLIAPPHGSLATAVQIAAYALAAAGLLAWTLSEMHPAAARYRAWLLPMALGAVAVGSGYGLTGIGNGSGC